jgi:hypothetical protein
MDAQHGKPHYISTLVYADKKLGVEKRKKEYIPYIQG